MDEIPDGVLLALVGFGGGLVLGLAARLGRFCTLGAIEEALYGSGTVRIRMWGVALGLAIFLCAGAEAMGWLSFESSIYRALTWNPAASIAGGLLFGYGMALAGNCGYGALARLGGGDLRSFVIVLVMGVSAYMTIGGPFAAMRARLFPANPADDPAARGIAVDISEVIGIPPLAIATLIAVGFIAWAVSNEAFRASKTAIVTGVFVALAVTSGWVGTSMIVEESFEDIRATSHTFTAPVGESIFYLMTSSAGGLSFSIGSVAGVLLGALLGSFRKGHFQWEACDDPRELRRQILGATLMGIGGVVALGCSIGQGMTAFAALSWSAPVTLAAIVAGAALGLRQLIHGFPAFRRS
ncbi:MAG: YeeE/YedE family protein [Pikeienuella sp.]